MVIRIFGATLLLVDRFELKQADSFCRYQWKLLDVVHIEILLHFLDIAPVLYALPMDQLVLRFK